MKHQEKNNVLEDVGTRQITKKGICVGNLWFVDLQGVMGAHVKQAVHVMKDTMDPSRIVLFRFNDAGIKEFLCEAWEASGIDLAKVTAIRKAAQKKLQCERRNKEWKNVNVGQMILDVERAAAAKIISSRARACHTDEQLSSSFLATMKGKKQQDILLAFQRAWNLLHECDLRVAVSEPGSIAYFPKGRERASSTLSERSDLTCISSLEHLLDHWEEFRGKSIITVGEISPKESENRKKS